MLQAPDLQATYQGRSHSIVRPTGASAPAAMLTASITAARVPLAAQLQRGARLQPPPHRGPSLAALRRSLLCGGEWHFAACVLRTIVAACVLHPDAWQQDIREVCRPAPRLTRAAAAACRTHGCLPLPTVNTRLFTGHTQQCRMPLAPPLLPAAGAVRPCCACRAAQSPAVPGRPQSSQPAHRRRPSGLLEQFCMPVREWDEVDWYRLGGFVGSTIVVHAFYPLFSVAGIFLGRTFGMSLYAFFALYMLLLFFCW